MCSDIPCYGEKAMAPHSSTLAWKIPWTEEPGGLQSMGSLRVGLDWATSLSLFTFMHWRRQWQPTPVFLPGESQGWGSLVGCRLWGRTVRHDWSDLAAAADYAVRESILLLIGHRWNASSKNVPPHLHLCSDKPELLDSFQSDFQCTYISTYSKVLTLPK